MPEIFTDNILRGWRLLNSSMGKWGLNFPLPFHHVDSFAFFSAATRIIVYTLLHSNLLTNFSIESIISFPKPMRNVSFHFLFLFLLHSLLSDWGGRKGKAEVSESNLLTFSPTWLSSLPVCHLLLQSSADHLFSLPAPKKKKKILFSFLLIKQSLNIKESHVSSLPSVDCQQSQDIIWKSLHTRKQGNQTQHVQRHQKSSNLLLELPQVFPGSKIYFNTVR